MYDAASNVIAVVDQLSRRTTFSYDALNRQTQTQNAIGGLATTVYDAADNVTAVVDELGRRTTFVYDAANRQTAIIDALTNRATTVYDLEGNVTAASTSWAGGRRSPMITRTACSPRWTRWATP